MRISCVLICQLLKSPASSLTNSFGPASVGANLQFGRALPLCYIRVVRATGTRRSVRSLPSRLLAAAGHWHIAHTARLARFHARHRGACLLHHCSSRDLPGFGES